MHQHFSGHVHLGENRQQFRAGNQETEENCSCFDITVRQRHKSLTLRAINVELTIRRIRYDLDKQREINQTFLYFWDSFKKVISLVGSIDRRSFLEGPLSFPESRPSFF